MKLPDFPITKLPNQALRFLQLRILFHQLLQAEARELYRNLGLFAFSFALIDCSFAIFWMPHFLPGTKSSPTFRLLNRQLGNGELPPARGKELRNVID